ncbi:MAG: hypothetical protein ACJAXN_002971 [Psychromonas sp.]|jgi:hypothetical protein
MEEDPMLFRRIAGVVRFAQILNGNFHPENWPDKCWCLSRGKKIVARLDVWPLIL